MNTEPKEFLDHKGNPLPKGSCPVCGHPFDAATTLCMNDPDARPAPGDASVCIECAEILVWDKDMHLRRAELNDLLQFSSRQRTIIGKSQEIIRERRAKR